VLDRDGIPADERLRRALEDQGVAVTVKPGDGYGEMTSHPQETQVPEPVLSEVLAWLQDGDEAGARGLSGTTAPDPIPVADSVTLRIGDARVIETPVTIAQDFGNLSGILTTPHDGRSSLCLVMLNAGAIRRVGPNRMWVEAARRWAQRGVSSLRLDVEAIGESDGDVAPYADDDALYVDALIPQVKAALADLSQRGVADQFVTAGLCAGAYWGMYVGLDDPRVTATLMFNSRGIVWDTGLAASRDLRRAFSQKLTWSRIRHNVTGPRLKAVARWLLGMPARWVARRRGGETAGSFQDRVSQVMHRMQASPLRCVFVFSVAEPLEEELVAAGWLPGIEDWPNVTVTRLAVRDHTLRPLMAQQQAHAALDQAVESELGVVAPSA
jgi:hypothetical protein